MTWVVVDDPIPAGASHLGTGLARDSQIATGGSNELASPAFVERSFDAYRALLRLPAEGQDRRSSTTSALNQSGHFAAAADARRGAVRAGDVRRDPERGGRGEAVMMATAPSWQPAGSAGGSPQRSAAWRRQRRILARRCDAASRRVQRHTP